MCVGLTEALALVGGTVHEHLGGDDAAEREKHLQELAVPELLRQVVDEEVTALWSCSAHTHTHHRYTHTADTHTPQTHTHTPHTHTHTFLMTDDLFLSIN